MTSSYPRVQYCILMNGGLRLLLHTTYLHSIYKGLQVKITTTKSLTGPLRNCLLIAKLRQPVEITAGAGAVASASGIANAGVPLARTQAPAPTSVNIAITQCATF